MYRLIETYDETATVDVAGRTLPVQCLVEDDDGMRLMLTPDTELRAHYWAVAHASGASAIITPMGSGWGWILAERFMEERTSDNSNGTYLFEPTHHSVRPPSYREMLTQSSAVTVEASPAPAAMTGEFVHLHVHSEYCLAPDTMVVTADMVWKKIKDVAAGEELVGFDEDLRPPEGEVGNSRSKMRRSTVIAAKKVIRDCYRITLEDGTEIVSSAQHGWVVTGTTRGSLIEPDGPPGGSGGNTRRWLTTEKLATGRTMPKLVSWARPWDEVPLHLQRDAAWLAGLADGEGWLHDGQFSLGQNPGPVMDEIQAVCERLGYPTTTVRQQSNKAECQTFRFAGYETALRFLSQCKPVRFKDRWDEVWVGRRAGSRYARPVAIVSVEHLGERETIALTTSTKTFVAEGFLSHNSPLDGLSKVEELIATVVADNQPALAITDHGYCASHPELQKLATKADIKPIFGVEANFTDNRFRRGDSNIEGDSKFVLYDYRHLILWAETQKGLSNLWGAGTQANIEGFYGRPRLDWDTLETFAEGLMASTACLRGPISQAILADDEELALQRLQRLRGLFGEGLFVELHTNQMPEQKKVNEALVSLAREYSLPTIAVVDSHYPCEKDQHSHRVWIASQTGKDVSDDADLFVGEHQYHMMTASQVQEALSYLPESVVAESMANTLVVADRAHAEVTGKVVAPVFSRPTKEIEIDAAGDAARLRQLLAEIDKNRLVELCMRNWNRRTVGKRESEEVYLARFEREMRLLIDKGFCGYFLIVADQVNYAKNQGILVGPGRGSGSGCLVAYLCGITEVDPVEADLMFERFLTEGRDALPDFDIDYPSSKRDQMQDYCTERWGAEYVMRVGTQTRLKNRGVVRDMARVLKPLIEDLHYPDIDRIAKIIEAAEAGTAGKGLSWEELWAQAGDLLQPYKDKYPLIFDEAENLVGRLKTYARHAAGMVIATDEPLTDRYPMRASEESNQPISEFDMKALEELGLVKFDLLTLRTLDTLQMCMDLIEAIHGTKIDIYSWTEEQYDDPMIWEEIGIGHTMGMFQIESNACTRLCKQFQPRSISDLADVITLVRPGPTRSGLTDAYFRRRAGVEEVTFVDPRLEKVLAPTQGCIIYQEQVMAACQVLGGYSLAEADDVRRLLGKKETEKVAAAGAMFVRQCSERGMDQAAAEHLWEQLGEFAKYSFNKSHAWAYAMIGYWCAWFKIHYPSLFLTAALSTVKAERIPDFINEAHRIGYEILPPDVNESGAGFSPVGGVSVRYGLEGIKGVGEKAVPVILEGQPYESYDDFVEKTTGTAVDAGVRKILVRVGAFDSIIPNRRALEESLLWDASKDSGFCVDRPDPLAPGVVKVNINGVPCNYDWDAEPAEIGKSGRPLKKKPPAKKCTRSCRHYRQIERPDFDSLEPYTPTDIGDRERELLGLYLSYSPFDRISDADLAECSTAEDLEQAPEGEYLVAGVITEVKKRVDKSSRDYAFIKIHAQTGALDMVVFSKAWAKFGPVLTMDRLCLFLVQKTSRGYTFNHCEPL